MTLIADAPHIEIAGRRIGPGEKPYVVAEMSGNHNGDIKRAFRILEAAKASGADAVKLQTYRADTITIDHDGPEFTVQGGLWHGRRLYELYEEAHTPWEWHAPIFQRASELDLTVFSSPFDATAVDFLEHLGAPAYKIASPEIVDVPLIRYVARTGKPIIISTGTANLTEISEALAAARVYGPRDIALLHCTAAYPAPAAEANLSTIADLAERFGVVVGLSDHTMGTIVPTLAVGLGASLIEKHFTLDRADGGVDSAFSMEPDELRRLISDVEIASAAHGSPAYQPTQSETSVLANRRSLYVVASIARGDVFTTQNVRSIRPANGLAPKFLDVILGRTATRDLVFGEALSAEMVSGGLL
jgi:N-acetylneuraminate synthase